MQYMKQYILNSPIILDPAVGDGNLTQSLEPESFAMGWSFTIWECPTPLQSDSNSRSCINLPSRTAGSRIISFKQRGRFVTRSQSIHKRASV